MAGSIFSFSHRYPFWVLGNIDPKPYDDVHPVHHLGVHSAGGPDATPQWEQGAVRLATFGMAGRGVVLFAL